MDFLAEMAAAGAGAILGLVAARAILNGVLTMTFGAREGAQGWGDTTISAPTASRRRTASSSIERTV
jgi:hypothetical protein